MPTLREGFYDEMIDGGGTPRPHAQTLVEALEALGPDQLAAAGRRRDAIFMQQGITFDAAGPDADGPVRDRPFLPRAADHPGRRVDVDQPRPGAAHPRAEHVHRRRLPRARDRPRRLVPWELLGYT